MGAKAARQSVSRGERSFGHHVHSLRRARGLTQEQLADRCGLSADTIRRLEHGDFSPSLDTLRKLCAGLELQLSTLFEGYELGEARRGAELADLVSSHSDARVKLATSVVRVLFEELDVIESDDDEPDDDKHVDLDDEGR